MTAVAEAIATVATAIALARMRFLEGAEEAMPALGAGWGNWPETGLGSPAPRSATGAASPGPRPIGSTDGTDAPHDLQNFFPCGTAQPHEAQRSSGGSGISAATNRVPHSRQNRFSPGDKLPQVGQAKV